MQQVDIYERLSKTYNVIIEDNGVSLAKDVIADKSDLLKIVQELKESGFDMLRLISSVDYSDKFFIVYHFLSTVNSNVFTLKVPLIKSDASKIDSLCDLYDSANWLEREVYDLIYLSPLLKYKNIIIKFGRYIPNSENKYDEILGVTLASQNQYAKRVTKYEH